VSSNPGYSDARSCGSSRSNDYSSRVALRLRAHLAGTAVFAATDETAHMIGNYMIADGSYSMIGA
jgi:hypothetical protein